MTRMNWNDQVQKYGNSKNFFIAIFRLSINKENTLILSIFIVLRILQHSDNYQNQ